MSERATLRYVNRLGEVLLEREGAGRYVAYVVPVPGAARIRVGIVLGGGRLWIAELIGRPVAIRAPSRPRLAAAIAQWAQGQAGVKAGVEKFSRRGESLRRGKLRAPPGVSPQGAPG